MPPIKNGKVSPLREETFLSVRESIRNGDRRHFYQQNRLSLPPLPLPCHQQTADIQTLLQGGNGGKGLKKYSKRSYLINKNVDPKPIFLVKNFSLYRFNYYFCKNYV
ncbi:MAG: hypothetical protein IJ069_07085 [Prevotella sp.]|nr:hypothetical protein [Prevotella sp.]